MRTIAGPVACPTCGAPSWNASLNPGESCLPCKTQAKTEVTQIGATG